MAVRYLLDTNTASYIIKDRYPLVRRHLVRHAMSEIAISAVTQGELEYGVAPKPEAARLRALIDEFLLRVAILPWDSDTADRYGELRAALEREGQAMGSLDMMIAACALSKGLTLVTSDHAFSRIAKLKIQDWTKP